MKFKIWTIGLISLIGIIGLGFFVHADQPNLNFWTYSFSSGLLSLKSSINQILIGGTATTSPSKLEVQGGATFDNSTSTSSYLGTSAGLSGIYINNWTDLGLILGSGNPFNQWLDTTSTPTFAGAMLTASTTISGNLTVSTVNTLTVGLGNNSRPGNTAVGINALGGNNTDNGSNVAIGYYALQGGVSDTGGNVAVGRESLYSNTSGNNNVAIGIYSSELNATGDENTAVGISALYKNISGSRNVAIGSNAGGYETGSDSFYVDNRDRSNTTGDKTKALLYGNFAALPANQQLTINAHLSVTGTSTFSGGVTTTDSIYAGGYASTTGGLYTQGSGHYGGNLTVVGSGLFTGNLNVGGNATTSGRTVLGTTNPTNNFGKLWVGGDIYNSGSASTTGSLYVGGQVGIGTVTPAYKLAVNSTDATSDLFQVATTTKQDIFVIDKNGRVGIGTSTSLFTLSIVAPASASTESVFWSQVSDAPSDYFGISNMTGIATQFIPGYYSHHGSDARQSNFFLGTIPAAMDILYDGDGTYRPIMEYDSRRGSYGIIGGEADAAVVTRPLFAWSNYGEQKMTMWPTGNLGLGTGVSPVNVRLEVVGTASSTNLRIADTATTTKFYVTGLATPAGSFLAVNGIGQVIATTTPSSGGHTAVIGEVPSGTINGSNTTFTLAHTPSGGVAAIYINGFRYAPGSGNDYTISGATITMLSVPATSSSFLVDYNY